MHSGFTRGRVLNGELYAQIFQMLIYLHLFIDCISLLLHSSIVVLQCILR